MSTRTSVKKRLHEEALMYLKNALRIAHTKRILVIGDVMLDEFVYGTTERMSPEAPVPILRARSKKTYLGGAGNTACNLAKFGVQTTLIGVIGDDVSGAAIKTLAKESGIKAKLVTEKDFNTTTKTRLVGERGHLLRVDEEALLPPSQDSEDALIATIAKLKKHDAVIISDYAKGVMTKRVMDALRTRFDASLIHADIKPKNIHLYKNIGLIKANAHEAAEITGVRAASKEKAEEALRLFYSKAKCTVLITRGRSGMSLFDAYEEKTHHIPALRVAVKDVTGAGDATLATLVFLRVHNISLPHASHAASYVAGKAVSEEGTSSVQI